MAGDSEWKSADQGERLKLLLEESRGDSEKVVMLIELLETGFFNANSQLESEDDSGDGEDEIVYEYIDAQSIPEEPRLPSSASDSLTRPIPPLSPIPTSVDVPTTYCFDSEESDPEGAAGLRAMQDGTDNLDRRFGGITFQAYAPGTSPLPPPTEEQPDTHSDYGGIDLSMYGGGYAGNLQYGNEVGSPPAENPEARGQRVAGPGELARLDAQTDEATDARREFRVRECKEIRYETERRSPSPFAIMQGAFEDDIEFTATLAAGLQDSGFDPNIVIESIHDPTSRLRSPSPGSTDKNHHPPPADTATDPDYEQPLAAAAVGLVEDGSVDDGDDQDSILAEMNERHSDIDRETSGKRERSVSFDSQIANRGIKLALDPEYGDLLPLPPSEPGSPISLPLNEDLPELPGTRPDTKPEDLGAGVDRGMVQASKMPSRTAVPVQSYPGRRFPSPGDPLSTKSAVSELKPMYLLELNSKLEEEKKAEEERKRKEKEAEEVIAQYKAKEVERIAKEKAEKEEHERGFQRLLQERLIEAGLNEKEIQAILKNEKIKREEEAAKKEEQARPVYTATTDARLAQPAVPPSVPAACLDCRRKFLKCDGTAPGPCSRCTSSNTECAYIPSRRGYKGPRKNPAQNPKHALVACVAGAAAVSQYAPSPKARQSRRASREKSPGEPGSPISQLNDHPTLPDSRQQPVFEPCGKERKTWISNPLSWARKQTLNLSRRVVRHLEKSEQDPNVNVDDLAYGEFYGAAVSPRDEPSKSASPVAPFQAISLFVANNHIPSATGVGSKELPESSSRSLEPDPGMGGGTLPQPSTTAKRPSEFEALLRAKVFKPSIKLTTFLPEPNWDTPDTAIHRLFWETKALTRHSLLPLGQFIAEREREMRETLKEIELGVGVSVSGFGVEVSSKGFLPLLKPYQWINMWRNVPREMYVCDHPSKPGGEAGGKLDMEKLHELENELMSSVKYQCGESEYITVITYSDVVKSGAVALLKAEFGRGCAVTGLRLEARFKDMPKEICRMLIRDGNPNRIELRRVGRTLSCRARGKQPAPRPVAVVSGRKEWTTIGGGWRRALHITLHDDSDLGSSPREGLVATVPQMLALLHLRWRLVDCVPSTPTFTFEPPLLGKAEGLATNIRRGIKLLGPPSGASHVGNSVTIAVLFSRESRWVTEQLFWA